MFVGFLGGRNINLKFFHMISVGVFSAFKHTHILDELIWHRSSPSYEADSRRAIEEILLLFMEPRV
jgi:hypothetical protein